MSELGCIYCGAMGAHTLMACVAQLRGERDLARAALTCAATWAQEQANRCRRTVSEALDRGDGVDDYLVLTMSAEKRAYQRAADHIAATHPEAGT
jgi:hypothetical protein